MPILKNHRVNQLGEINIKITLYVFFSKNFLYWVISPQFHDGISFLLLYIFALDRQLCLHYVLCYYNDRTQYHGRPKAMYSLGYAL